MPEPADTAGLDGPSVASPRPRYEVVYRCRWCPATGALVTTNPFVLAPVEWGVDADGHPVCPNHNHED